MTLNWSTILSVSSFLTQFSVISTTTENCGVDNDFRICHCEPSQNLSPTEIDCINVNFKGDEILHLISNSHFTNLRKITFRGNYFPYLLPNVFGFKEELIGNIHEIDLSSNSIENISKEAFCGMKNVKILDLSDNKVMLSEEESSIFEHMKLNLIQLKLKNFFAQPIQSDVQLVHLQRIFKISEFKNLHMLDLSSNSLDYVPPKFLCDLKNLKNFYLSDNRLTTLDLDVNCMQELQVFDLSKNRFINLDPNFMNTMSGLKKEYSLKLFANPFECNCNSTPYLDWIRRSMLIINRENLTCHKASPKHFVGKAIYPDVALHNMEQLDCNPPVGASGRSHFCNYCLVLAFILAFIFI